MWIDIPCAETSAERRRPSRQNYQSARVAPSISAIYGFPLKLISTAFQDATQVRAGEPTELAREAFEWLSDDSFKPASFRWACHWLGLDPERVRKYGLPKGSNVVHQFRGDWQETRIRFSGRTSPSLAQRRQGGAIPRRSAVL